jgi:hypothetical protein
MNRSSGGCAGDARCLRGSRCDHAAAPLAVRRPDSVETHQRMARWGHQCGKTCQELYRCHQPHLVGVLDPVTDPAVVEHGEPLERDGRASTVAEQAFACGGQTSGHADAGVEIELQVLSAQTLGRLRQRETPCWVSALLGAAVLGPALQLSHAQAALQASHPGRGRVRVLGGVFVVLASKVAVLFEPANGSDGDDRDDLLQVEACWGSVFQRVDLFAGGIR